MRLPDSARPNFGRRAGWLAAECAPVRGAGPGPVRGPVRGTAFARGRMRSRTRLSKLTGTANMTAPMRPSSTGDIAYPLRDWRTAVACARDIDMTVLPGLISSTVPGLLEMMNA